MKLFNAIQQDDLSACQEVNPDSIQEKILLAMIGPILFGFLASLKHEVVKDYGTINDILLRQLARACRYGFGDCGVCFEYAVHSAIRNNNPLVMERIRYALALCGVTGNSTTSILLGFEKAGVLQITDELVNTLTPDSRLITGLNGESLKIKEYIKIMIDAFRNKSLRRTLPDSICDIWKSDLFIGNTDSDMWVAASVKINQILLTRSRGLCMGIVPAKWNQESAWLSKDGMIVCPLLYSKGFVEYFYSAWEIVTKFLKSDALLPKERDLWQTGQRRVAKYLESMRERPVMELLSDDLKQLAHPTLVGVKKPKIVTVDVFNASVKHDSNMVIIAPDPLLVPGL